MRYKHLKRADITISEFSIGTWALSGRNNYGPIDRNEAIAGIRTAIDHGVTHIDTAPVYGNGYSEQLVGEALADGYREKVLVSTKFGLSPNTLTRMNHDAGFKNIIREVESSLMNLKTDHIDFYFVHWPDPNTPIAETMSALTLLKKIGKIRFIGVSNFSKEQILEAEQYGVIDVLQPQFSMVNQNNKELMDWAFDQGIDSFTYGSLGSGILSGQYRELPKFEKNDTRVTFYDYFKEPKFSKIQKLLKVMDAVAENHNCSVAQVAINWSTQYRSVSTALIGITNSIHALENCAAFDWQLSEDEIKLLDEAIKKEVFDS